jgi:hypothetical protein
MVFLFHIILVAKMQQKVYQLSYISFGVVIDVTPSSLLDLRRIQLDQIVEMLGARSAFPNSQY